MISAPVPPLKLVPADHATALAAWLHYATFPEDQLLQAVIRNDLAGAVAAIGGSNDWPGLRAAVIWMWNFAPVECWGSPDHVEAWRQLGGLYGHVEKGDRPQ